MPSSRRRLSTASNRGQQANLNFFRDSKGLECDLFYPAGDGIAALEVKSGATVSSEHFQPLHRVAELVPGVTSKTVVYGGATRQSRSDSEAIALVDLPGTLKMLDVNTEIAAFVEANRGPAPGDADLQALDEAFTGHIRPVLDGLEPTLGPLANALFRRSSQASFVRLDNAESNSSSLLEARHWETTKARHIVSQGFRLSRSRPLELRHLYRFGNYTGRGSAGFNVELAMVWRLDGERLTRSIAIDGSPLPELAASVPYEGLDGGNRAMDSTVAEIGGRIMRRIGELSAAS